MPGSRSISSLLQGPQMRLQAPKDTCLLNIMKNQRPIMFLRLIYWAYAYWSEIRIYRGWAISSLTLALISWLLFLFKKSVEDSRYLDLCMCVLPEIAWVCTTDRRRREVKQRDMHLTKKIVAMVHVRSARLWTHSCRSTRFARHSKLLPSRRAGLAEGDVEQREKLVRNKQAHMKLHVRLILYDEVI